eukprot:TRINITY_DN3486_c0_g1_i2.p1 TRINITY_DN3486_c0_g1~~TRINITY_DN3486_c0_g1_i2.p1  ORF type:complete len:1258 (-),score=327.51 TRINITY_DN3486_c0_g1_i2:53-3805(-)
MAGDAAKVAMEAAGAAAKDGSAPLALVQNENSAAEPLIPPEHVISDEEQKWLSLKESLASPSASSTVYLIGRWLSSVMFFYIEVFIFSGLAYYVDVLLDLNTIYIFLNKHQYRYTAINVGAILAANAYTMSDMMKEIDVDGAHWIGDPGRQVLLLGFLVPVYLHVGLLVWISWRKGKKHPLLTCAKLAEAAIEASISAFIQTYALIFSDWDTKEWIAMSVSVVFSCGSIGYAFTCFDKRGVGLNGIPGQMEHWNVGLILVLITRCAEVASRITSLALFCTATRHALDHADFMEHDGIFFDMLRLVMLTGAPLVLGVDLVVLLTLTCCYQSRNRANLQYAIPSMLCFVNPLLELGSPSTIPAPIYYSWRWIELIGMAGLAYYVNGEEKLLHCFHDDIEIVKFCAGTTLLWTIMLPIVRLVYADHVLFKYDDDMLSVKPFNRSQQLLSEKLMLSNEIVGAGFSDWILGRSDYTLLSQDSQSKRTTASDHLRGLWRESLRKSLADLDRAVSVSKDRAHMKKLEIAEGERQEDAVEPKNFMALYSWGKRVLHEHEESLKERGTVKEQFGRVLCLGTNILPMSRGDWKCSVGKEKHYQLLVALKNAMNESDVVKQQGLSMLKDMVKILPLWSQWDDEDMDWQLFKEKAAIVLELGTKGWQAYCERFHPDCKLLMRSFDARPRDDPKLPTAVPKLPMMKDMIWQDLGPKQTRVLCKIWSTIPEKHTMKPAALEEIFRPGVEWLAMLDGCDCEFKKLVEKLTARKSTLRQCGIVEESCLCLHEASLLGLKMTAAENERKIKLLKEVEDWLTEYINSLAKDVKDALDSGKTSRQVGEVFKILDTENLHIQKLSVSGMPPEIEEDKKKEGQKREILKSKFYWATSKAPGLLQHVQEKWKEAQKGLDELKVREENEKAEQKKREEEEAQRLVQQKIQKAREDEAKAHEEEKRRLKMEAEERKQEQNDAEEYIDEMEQEREQLENQNRDLENQLLQVRDQSAIFKREQRRLKQNQKLKEQEMRRMLQRQKLKSSNGLVVVANIDQDLDAFVEYIDDDGQRFLEALAGYFKLPSDAIGIDEIYEIHGSVNWTFTTTSAGHADMWTRLDDLASGKSSKPLRASGGLKVSIADVNKAAKKFSVKFEGKVSNLTQDEDVQEDVLEEIEAQLGLEEGELDSAAFTHREGTMTYRIFVSITSLAKKTLQREELELPGIQISLRLDDKDEELEEDEDDGLSPLGSLGGDKATRGTAKKDGLRAINEDE